MRLQRGTAAVCGAIATAGLGVVLVLSGGFANAQSSHATGPTVTPYHVTRYAPVKMNFGSEVGRGTLIINWNEYKDIGRHGIPRVVDEVPVATVALTGGGTHTIEVPVVSKFVRWAQHGVANLNLVARFGAGVANSAIPLSVQAPRVKPKVAPAVAMGVAGTGAGEATASFHVYQRSNAQAVAADARWLKFADDQSGAEPANSGDASTTGTGTSTSGTGTSTTGTSTETTGTATTGHAAPPPYPGCTWANFGKPVEVRVRLGELHVAAVANAQGQFEYTDNVDSEYGIAWSLNGDGGWYDSGTASVNNNVGSGGSENGTDGYRWYVDGDIWSQRMQGSDLCAGARAEDVLYQSLGDAVRGTRQPPSKPYASCHVDPTGRAEMNPKGDWWSDHGTAIRYGAGFGFAGIGLSAQTGYSNSVQIKYWDNTSQNLWVCGSKGMMDDVPVLYESTW
jgi:hypothetical protein